MRGKGDWDKTSRALEARSGPPVGAWRALEKQIREARIKQRKINNLIVGKVSPIKRK